MGDVQFCDRCAAFLIHNTIGDLFDIDHVGDVEDGCVLIAAEVLGWWGLSGDHGLGQVALSLLCHKKATRWGGVLVWEL